MTTNHLRRFSRPDDRARSAGAAFLVAALLSLPTALFPAPATPTGTEINSVQFSGNSSSYTVSIEGNGFGAPVVRIPFAGNLPNFRIADKARTDEWGYIGDGEHLTYVSWSDTKIVVSHFGGHAGDAVVLAVWNAKSGAAATWGGNIPSGSAVPANGRRAMIAAPRGAAIWLAPRIKWVRFSGSGRKVRIVVSGTGFGPAPADLPSSGVSGRSRYFNFQDFRAHCGVGSTLFSAGGDHWGVVDPDPVELVYESWSDTQIVISGFGEGYGIDCATYQPGDPVVIAVWNSRDAQITGPQTAWGGIGDSPLVKLGQTIDDVIAIFGQPDQIVDLGNTVTYVYKGRKIVFAKGRVTDIGLSQVVSSPIPTETQTSCVDFADFSTSATAVSGMSITPLPGFLYNDRFPAMFGGTWRIVAPGGGFTGTFSVPADGQYELVVTHGSSYDDLRRKPGYSPVTIRVNSQTIVQDYDPASHHPGVKDLSIDRWQIFAHAGQNTLQLIEGSGTTHYWIHRIEIRTGGNRAPSGQ